MNSNIALLIGLLAGLAAGLMVLAGFAGGSVSLVLIFASPAAVYIASLGWGTIAGVVAAIGGSVIAAYAAGPQSAIFAAALLFGPAAWAGHLANLGQPAPDGRSMLWYPLPAILIRMSIAIGVGFLITGLAYGYNTQTIAKGLEEVFGEFVRANPQLAAPRQEDLAATARAYAAMMPVILPLMWLMLHVLVFYLAAMVARQSGKMARPGWDIPAEANLPYSTIGLPLAGLVGMTIAPSPVYEIAAIMTGVGIAAFGLVGLADLHLKNRGRPGRGMLLFASWMLIFMFGLPLLIFAVFGALRAWRSRPGGGSAGMPPSGTPPAPPQSGPWAGRNDD